MTRSQWIWVDLDGTLAHFKEMVEWDGSIGDPIPEMVQRVKRWLAAGMDVRIMTARVAAVDGITDGPRAVDEQQRLVRAWCLEHIGVELPVTAQKDYYMQELWDDRVVQVVPNTGRPLRDLIEEGGQL